MIREIVSTKMFYFDVEHVSELLTISRKFFRSGHCVTLRQDFYVKLSKL